MGHPAVVRADGIINGDFFVCSVGSSQIIQATKASRIDQYQRVVPSIGVEIPTLRIVWMLINKGLIRAQEAPHRRRIVPSPEVVVSRFCVSFFAGRMVPLQDIQMHTN